MKHNQIRTYPNANFLKKSATILALHVNETLYPNRCHITQEAAIEVQFLPPSRATIQQSKHNQTTSTGDKHAEIKGAIPRKSIVQWYPAHSALHLHRSLARKISKLGATTKHIITELAKSPMSASTEPTFS